MKKIDFPKNIQCLIQQSIDILKLKLSVINKGHTQNYFLNIYLKRQLNIVLMICVVNY